MKRNSCLLIIFLCVTAFIVPQKKQTIIYLIGDSTMSIKDVRAYPETGWGMPFTDMFDSTIVVDNRAKNGRSTKTFITENLWQPVVAALKEGDYVFLEFGHNDEVKEKVGSYTTPGEYKANLLRFITETKAKKAIPVLLTAVSRRKFDSAGTAMETHAEYSPLVREVARQTGVAFIDMDQKTRELYQHFGVQGSTLLFLHLDPGEHPNYPSGKIDNTHFNELGARKVAQLVVQEIRNQKLELASHIYQPIEKK